MLDCWDLDWMFSCFPQLITYPRVDVIEGPSRGGNSRRGAAQPARNPTYKNVTHYEARVTQT
jgi:hypothetical protein